MSDFVLQNLSLYFTVLTNDKRKLTNIIRYIYMTLTSQVSCPRSTQTHTHVYPIYEGVKPCQLVGKMYKLAAGKKVRQLFTL